MTTNTLACLHALRQKVLWLSTWMIHHANHVRPNRDGLKVGGHQASSASMASIMTALWFEHLRAPDRVSVKPHASPVLHAIEYLLGKLDREYLTTLRAFGGLQSYPSRLKDPVPADFSTGSVGIGATAPIWGTIARRYAEGLGQRAGTGRQFSLVGDAELDEGSNWEAVQYAGRVGLSRLTAIVVDNHSSTHGWPGGIGRRFELEGWSSVVVDGRDHDALERALIMRHDEWPHIVVADVRR
jgi:pyruvate dehydrogenase E1 component